MPLSLMYITNRPEVAQLAQDCGVDRIFVDLEHIGKDLRQAGLDTVKSHHTFDDIERIKMAMGNGASQLQVRINPVHDGSADHCSTEEEVNIAIDRGADILMLPMFRTTREAERFLSAVNGRAKTLLLLETKEALEAVDSILDIRDFDELHIGLNDLHLAYGRKFMFEFYVDGTLDWLTAKIRARGIPFGIGGIARIGYGLLPAEYIIAEHYRLKSRMAILSRSFCDANKTADIDALRDTFLTGIQNIRAFESRAANFTAAEFEENHRITARLINDIVRQR